jgi:hypothetical protein
VYANVPHVHFAPPSRRSALTNELTLSREEPSSCENNCGCVLCAPLCVFSFCAAPICVSGFRRCVRLLVRARVRVRVRWTCACFRVCTCGCKVTLGCACVRLHMFGVGTQADTMVVLITSHNFFTQLLVRILWVIFLHSTVILNDGTYCMALSGSCAGLSHVYIGYALRFR